MRLWWRSLENGRTSACCKMILQRLFGHPCDVGLDRMLWRVGRVLSRRLKSSAEDERQFFIDPDLLSSQSCFSCPVPPMTAITLVQ